ncbi:MAG: DNA translocase FtsK 4TM domain-containing protein [bacterium]|nr:DNA translocase FtsK 4TM domain-containing protein [bacterium]
MAKKSTKKSTKSKSAPARAPMLPAGFWEQVFAVFLGIFSLFLVMAWFGIGGQAMAVIHSGIQTFMGWAVFFLPFVLIFLSVEIFRDEKNKLPYGKAVAFFFALIFIASFFGLFKGRSGVAFGGMLGSFTNNFALQIVNPFVAGIVYLFAATTIIFAIFGIMPIDAIKKIGEMLKTADFEKSEKGNKKVLEALKIDKNQDMVDEISDEGQKIKLNAGVEILGEPEKPLSRREKRALIVRKQKEDIGEKESDAERAPSNIDDSNWKLPEIGLLSRDQSPADAGDIDGNARKIRETFAEFDISVEMEAANVGPRITQYTLRPPRGVKLSRFNGFEDNLRSALAVETVRVEAPVPGKSVVGIEVPNKRAATVRLANILESKEWKKSHGPLTFAVGKDISGETIVGDLAKMPHLLIAGTTGSGKSVMMNTLLTSLLYRNSPAQLRLILVDPKQVEMAPYEDIPHLLTPVIQDPTKTVSALKWAVNEMERRYSILAEKKIRNIESYNKTVKAISEEEREESGEESMPYIVIVIDELADLMMVASKDAEALIVRIAQKARAVGIHLVLATQKPVVSVVTGLIKGNVPSRISFKLPSNSDSRTILDRGGAEKLLGQGDMLYFPNGAPDPKRAQGVFLQDEEVNAVMNYLRLQSPPRYNDDIISQPVNINNGGVVMGEGSSSMDETFRQAVEIAIRQGNISTSLLQRKMRIGYGRAATIVDQMEERGIVGPSPGGSKPREVLISSLEEIE